MKKLFTVLWVLAFPFVAWSQQNVEPCLEGQDECKYTDKLVFEVIDGKTGQVVDRTTYERLVPVNYNQVMLMKYLRMIRQAEGGAKTYLDILTAGGDAKQALETQTGP